MKKLLVLALLCLPLSVIAEEVTPNQEVQNTKSYTGINYNRQDSEQTGTQKKGALFKDVKDLVPEKTK